MRLNLPSSLVSVEWLSKNLSNESLIILDATIQKVGTTKEETKIKQQIPNAVFLT